MKVVIYSNKLFLKVMLILQGIVIGAVLAFALLSLPGSFLTGQPPAVYEYIEAIVIIEAIIIPTIAIFYFVYLRGRKLEIDGYGINMGKRYYGPYKSQAEISAYRLLSFRKKDLILHWNEIDKIHIGVWSRFWARHWNIITPHLSGEKMSNPEKVAQVINIPARRWKGYFLTIITKKSEIYAIEVNIGMLQQLKSTIKSFGKIEILDVEEYTV